jgi:hypothetical protein
MRKDEVPQDQDNLNEGKLTKLYYATDTDGHYTQQNSIGSEVETVVMRQAWEVVNEQVQEALEKVRKNEASPILYFKEKNIMTWAIVAGYVSTFSFICWLHSKPFFFKRLSDKMLEKYAYAFRISIEDLKNFENYIAHQAKSNNEN